MSEKITHLYQTGVVTDPELKRMFTEFYQTTLKLYSLAEKDVARIAIDVAEKSCTVVTHDGAIYQFWVEG